MLPLDEAMAHSGARKSVPDYFRFLVSNLDYSGLSRPHYRLIAERECGSATVLFAFTPTATKHGANVISAMKDGEDPGRKAPPRGISLALPDLTFLSARQSQTK